MALDDTHFIRVTQTVEAVSYKLWTLEFIFAQSEYRVFCPYFLQCSHSQYGQEQLLPLPVTSGHVSIVLRQ